MAFVKTDQYWEHKINMTLEAIVGTRESLKDLTEHSDDNRAIEAYAGQIDSYFKSIRKSIDDYEKWMIGGKQ